MSLRRLFVLPSVALVTTALAIVVGAGVGIADQPVNPSFEHASTFGWSQNLNGGEIAVESGLGAPVGTGFYTARLEAGDGDVPVQLSQTVNLAVGEVLSGWASFQNFDCLDGFDDTASVVVVAPSSATTVEFSASSCTGSVPFTPWAFIASEAGAHTIIGSVTNAEDGGFSSVLLMDADTGPGPHWEMVMKVGGGNILNPSLPGYVRGTWSAKNVMLYLKCVPGEGGAPIDLVRSDQAVSFKDGVSYFSTKPTDTCIDENGNAATPIINYGPIMVDTKAPTCKITPTTQFIPRNTQQTVYFDISTVDAMSADPILIFTSYSVSGGAVLDVIDVQPTGPTSYLVEVDATMGSSTAGKVDATFVASDQAGNQTTCKLTVKAK